MTTRPTRGRVRVLLGALVATALVAPAASAETLPDTVIISEYVESSNLQALELFNGTGADVDLTGWRVDVYFNGNTVPAGAPYSDVLSGTVAVGDTFVLGSSGVATKDQAHTSRTWFNGDDAIVLRDADGAVVDSIGQVGVDPGSAWGAGTSAATTTNTLRRVPTACTGDVDPGDAFDPTTEFEGVGTVTTAGLGSHAVACVDDTPEDTTPPELDVSVNPSVIRSRNHKMVPVSVTLAATDDVDQDVAIELVSVVSSDPDDGAGDGSTTGDVDVVTDTLVRVRAERSRSTSRVYTLTYTATDDAGNATTETATVTVR